ncbi:hypothetical protein GVN21_03915 [Caulobacter sp. SLTY]|uniref:hypothetical protein n=1 Tax=Caulobacter sp. SLTY TaxID=2683262 RepID=UPI001412DD2E|nr:hypothetical protein [Caulobacter sp. SLTY]NBB14504.1 hypothetical protein [Caulobacter sp. SLTY]
MTLLGVGPETASLLPPLRRRQISERLTWAILLFGPIFVWFLLRPGYSGRLRIAGFLYGLGPLAITFCQALASGS